MQAFITQQMKAEQSVFSPIPKNKLKTLSFLRTTSKLGKSGTSKAVINTDRELFNRLLVIAKSRSVDLREVFTHEMSPIPFSLAYADGTLRKTNKSTLLHLLERDTETYERVPDSDRNCTWIFDAMSLVHATKPTCESNFGEYATTLLNIVLEPIDAGQCLRVDVVFDRYDRQHSI